jgi:hypothetical protein
VMAVGMCVPAGRDASAEEGGGPDRMRPTNEADASVFGLALRRAKSPSPLGVRGPADARVRGEISATALGYVPDLSGRVSCATLRSRRIIP